MIPDLLHRKSRVFTAISALVLLALTGACGPELTEPASTDITGRWTSQNAVGPISEISMDLSQQSDGAVHGQWVGKSSVPNAVCPPDLGSNPTNVVTGSSTVLELHLSLLGAGDFDGQVTENILTGSFVSCEKVYPITFSRVQPAPGALTGS